MAIGERGCVRLEGMVARAAAAKGGAHPFLTAHFLTPPRWFAFNPRHSHCPRSQFARRKRRQCIRFFLFPPRAAVSPSPLDRPDCFDGFEGAAAATCRVHVHAPRVEPRPLVYIREPPRGRPTRRTTDTPRTPTLRVLGHFTWHPHTYVFTAISFHTPLPSFCYLRRCLSR